MREIEVKQVEELVKELCIKANLYLPEDMQQCICANAEKEQSPVGKNVFGDIIDNINVAREQTIPICQDTGMAVIFMDVGQDVHFVGGDINEALNRGVSRGYIDGRLRCSIVSDPLERDAACGASEFRAGRQGKDNGRTERFRQREYEPA